MGTQHRPMRAGPSERLFRLACLLACTRHAPRPLPITALGVLPALRRAILGTHVVELRHALREANEPSTCIACPYGLLYGGRGWLVAHVEGLSEMRLWRLDRIASVHLLDRRFQRREDFSLANYAARSFGVFQEEPMNVVLRFTPGAAEDAARWEFHPTQHTTHETDGSLTLRFRASGIQEICQHLFTWGAEVTIVQPDMLRTPIAVAAGDSAEHHGSFRSASGRKRSSTASS